MRLKDGRILSDFPRDEDPIHKDYLDRMATAAQELAKRSAAASGGNGTVPAPLQPEVPVRVVAGAGEGAPVEVRGRGVRA